MKKLIFILILSFLAANNNYGQILINAAWKKLDREKLTELLENSVYLKTDKAYEFLKRFKKLDIRSDEETGFGGKLYVCANYGGYTTQWINLLSFNDHIVSLSCSFGGEDNEQIASIVSESKALKQLCKKYGVFNKDGIFDLSYTDSSVYRGFMFNLAQHLGKPAEIKSDLPDSVRSSYEYLSDPLKDIIFGDYCGYGSTEIQGWHAINVLINSKRIDLIENTLRSGNPCGRMYAILALYSMETTDSIPISRDDLSAIKKLIELPVKISACSGCEGYTTTVSEVYGKVFTNRFQKD